MLTYIEVDNPLLNSMQIQLNGKTINRSTAKTKPVNIISLLQSWWTKPGALLGIVPPNRKQQQRLTLLILLSWAHQKALLYPNNQIVIISLSDKLLNKFKNSWLHIKYSLIQRYIFSSQKQIGKK